MEVVKSIIRLPFRLATPIVRVPVRVVFLIAGVRHRRCYSLSVAALDEARAQPIWFALRRAARTAEEQAVAERWLEGLQVCQVAFSLLLSELDEVEANLQFWHRRERAGGHFWSNLLQRGPVHFAGRLSVLLHLRQPAAGALSEADLVEKRVLIFRLLRSALCEALAQVQSAAGLLYLQQSGNGGAGGGGAGAGAGGAGAGGGRAGWPLGQAASAAELAAAAGAGPGLAPDAANGEESLFQRADRLVGASMVAVAAAFQQLDRSVHATLDAQQGPAAPPAADWQVLQGALTRVLGLHHLRRVLSMMQLQPGREEGAGEGPAAAGGGAGAAGGAAGAAAGLAGAAAEPPPAGGPGAAAGGPAGLPGSLGALHSARWAVGCPTLLLPAHATVHGALQAARRCARSMRARRLIQVPGWACMPSQLQQHWIRYVVIGGAVGWGSIFLYRHSRLSGSRDLDDWIRGGVTMLRGAYSDHVIAPLASVKNELFNTFRRRPTIVSMGDYEADRDSLQRMLDDFQRDFVRKRGAAAAAAAALPAPRSGGGGGGASSSASPAAAAAVPAGDGAAGDDSQLVASMDLVMRTYEREMQKPLRNLVGGELVRALLIQVQKLKVDTASAMLEMDQILKANELSISLLAAVPAFLIGGATLYYLGRMVTPTPPDPRREALPVRMAFVEVERALEHVAAAEEAAAAASAAGAEPPAEAAAESREQQGLLAFRLAVAYEEAKELFRRHRGLIAIGGSEWPNIRSDLLELCAPAAVSSKMRTAQRMVRSYALFQQF